MLSVVGCLLRRRSDRSARLMVHPVSGMMQSSSSTRSLKGLELETEGGKVAGMVGPGGKEWAMPPGRLLVPLAGV